MGVANPKKVKKIKLIQVEHKGSALKEEVVNQFGVATTVRVSSVGLAEPGTEIPGYLWLRRLAETQYVTNREGLTIVEMAKDPLYKDLSHNTMNRWSTEDRWVEKRQKFYDGISQRIQSKIGQGMMREQLFALKELQSLGADILEKLRDKQVRVGSYEGLVTAYLKLLDYETELQKQVSKEVVHESNGGVRTDTVRVAASLSEEEARVAVDTILRHRREQLRKKTAGDAEEKPADKEEDC